MPKQPRVSVKFEVNSSGYSAAVNKAKAQIIDFGNTSKRVSHGMVSDVQAASGTLRLIDGGIANNIRSAERFLASIKGVPEALRAIYPLVGGIAIGAVVARGVTELLTFQQKAREAGDQFRQSWQEMVNASRLGNDELAKTNIQLENQIAKLEGRHENTLALELAESRIEATKLAEAAASARDKVHQLFEEKGVGFGSLMGAYRMIFKGEAPTDDTQKMMQGYDTQIADATQDYTDAKHAGNQTAADAAMGKYRQLRAQQQEEYGRFLRGYRTMDPGDRRRYQANIDALQGGLNLSYDATDQLAEQDRNKKDQARLKQLQDAQTYKAEQEKAARALKQDMDDQLAQAKQDHLVSVAEEAQYWISALQAVRGGSAPMIALRVEINKRLAELSQEQRRNLERFQGARLASSVKPESSEHDVRELAAQVKEQVEAQERASTAAARLKSNYDESVISLQLATGQIGRLDAAQQLARIHAIEYQQEIAAIQKTLDFWNTAPDSPERSRALDEAGMQLDALTQAARISEMEDSARTAAETPLGAWKDTLAQYVQSSRDAASQVREIWSTSLGSVNEELVKMLTTRHNYGARQQWGDVGSGIFRSVANVGLQKAEGALLGAFGVGSGKPDGTQSKPLFVKLIGGVTSGVAGGGGLLDGLFGMGGGESESAAGGGGFLSGLASFGGTLLSGLGFADGGDPPVGLASMVGERGPELFVPKTAGTVVPNGQLGGVTHHTEVTVDARGATDPAAIDARIQRALPGIAAAVTHSQQNARARLPMGRRH